MRERERVVGGNEGRLESLNVTRWVEDCWQLSDHRVPAAFTAIINTLKIPQTVRNTSYLRSTWMGVDISAFLFSAN